MRGNAYRASYLDGISGPRPRAIEDLAGTWQFTPLQETACPTPAPVTLTGFGDSGPTPNCVNRPSTRPATLIQVPGGGWVKQGYPDVAEALYSRQMTVPDAIQGETTELVFGAVNHQATVYLSQANTSPLVAVATGTRVGTTTTSFTPARFDLTPHVVPGRAYTLTVDVKGRAALRDPAGYYTVPEAASWSPNIAQGIFRSAELDLYPALHISDIAVDTSVTTNSFSFDVTVANASGTPQAFSLASRLASSYGERWPYPKLPVISTTVAAHSTRTIMVGPVAWTAGRRSWWWPNVPYRRSYRAELHDLIVSLQDSAAPPKAADPDALVRFGFRQIQQSGDHFLLNGTRVNFRGDSLAGADYDSIVSSGGPGDAYDTLPGFLSPSPGNAGWPQAVRNYLRLNYNDIRVHQEPATPYMLDVADELGLMVLDETAIRGSNIRENFLTGRANMIAHVKALVERDRNHASVLRWSVSNEPNGFIGTNSGTAAFVPVVGPVESPGSGQQFDEALYQAAMSVDRTRPISSDGNPTELPHPNYTTWCHYDGGPSTPVAMGYTDAVCKGTPAPGKPYGQGEFIWPKDSTPQGFTQFATSTERMREQGASDIRPYTLLSGWASVIPEVRRNAMTLEQGGHPIYGVDTLPVPWSNGQIRRIELGFAPLLVADTDYWNANKLSDADGHWPSANVALKRGVPTTRQLVIFNDTFARQPIRTTWTLRTGSARGKRIAGGTMTLRIAPGSHVYRTITFLPPSGAGTLVLLLTAAQRGVQGSFSDVATFS